MTSWWMDGYLRARTMNKTTEDGLVSSCIILYYFLLGTPTVLVDY
jgi:hypothetical protein